MTREQNIRAGYKARHGREMTDEDFDSFLSIAAMFEIPVSDYETTFTKIDFHFGLLIDLERQTGELAL